MHMKAYALMGMAGIRAFVAGWATKGNSTTHHSGSGWAGRPWRRGAAQFDQTVAFAPSGV